MCYPSARLTFCSGRKRELVGIFNFQHLRPRGNWCPHVPPVRPLPETIVEFGRMVRVYWLFPVGPWTAVRCLTWFSPFGGNTGLMNVHGFPLWAGPISDIEGSRGQADELRQSHGFGEGIWSNSRECYCSGQLLVLYYYWGIACLWDRPFLGTQLLKITGM